MTARRYPEIPPDRPADQLELELLERWKAEDLFHETQRQAALRPSFVFYEGPPTANGRPGIHHVGARTIKDMVCRYQAMNGRQVTRIAGWDTHGLPVEIEVEKQLGITAKTQIGDGPDAKVSVAEFNRRCRESVWRYKAEWESLSDRIGYWLDYDHPYITYTNEYVESVWWLLSQLFAKGLLVRGHKVLPYCPRCGTALSSHELALGYDTAKDPSVYVLYPIEERAGAPAHGGADAAERYLLIWTTTPWTLVSNFAVAVHPEMDYVEVDWKGRRVILADSRRGAIIPGGDTEPLSKHPVLRRMKGSELVGTHYRPPLPVVRFPEGRKWEVVAGDFVTAEDGSGLVHMAPFGADDFAVARKHGFAYVVPVDTAGAFRGTTWPDIEGVFVKDADAAIMQRLKNDGLLLKRETVEHTYPFCWRCDTPLPVWVCEKDAAHLEVIGSYAQLAERWGTPLPADFDPHKPNIDAYTWSCRCGGTMRRVSEVIDTWFDSGSMPSAQWHYPFEHEAEFRSHFPAEFIAEGVDQTRGWFYSLLAIATGVFDQAPYRHVIVNELILDAQGQKMSKSRGNVVDPVQAVAKYGADAMRLYLLLSSQVWQPKRFDETAIADVSGGVLEKLRHTYNLFQLYAEDWAPSPTDPPAAQRPLADRWLLGRLERTVRTVCAAWDGYDVTAGTRAIVQFVVDDLSNWWVRLNRGRFWAPGRKADPAALATLHQSLVTASRLLAPAAPFLADLIHRALTGGSVHLAAFPQPGGLVDEPLEGAMDAVRRLASCARSARETVSLRVRQPLSRMLAALPAGVDRGLFEALVPLLVTEVNVKRVELVTSGTDLVSLEARPSFRALGKRFGKDTPTAAEAIKALSAADVARFESGERVTITVNGEPRALEPGDLVAVRHARGDLVVESDGEVVAALDPALTEELKAEGLAREVVSRVQRLRRDAGFDVSDRIALWVVGDEAVRQAVERHRGYISGETLAGSLTWADAGGQADDLFAQDVDLDGFKARIAVRRSVN